MAVTYNAGTNIITVVGFTEAVPCSYLTIYNADVAGGWGKVTKQCNNQFCFDCGLVVGDGSTATWFADKNKSVQFNIFNVSCWGGYHYCAMYIKPAANCIFGEIMSLSNKLGKNGCSIYFNSSGAHFGLLATGTGNLHIYSCYIGGLIQYGVGGEYSPIHTGDLIIWNSMINLSTYIKSSSSDVDRPFVNLYQKANTYGIDVYGPGTGVFTLEKPTVFGTRSRGAISLSGNFSLTVKNAFIRDCTNFLIVWDGVNVTHHIINADSSTWTIKNWTSHTATINREYEFELKVIQENSGRTPISGATVKIWDVNNSLVVDTTTDVNGDISKQTLLYGYYNYAGGNTPVIKTPHKIEIKKNGTNFLSITKYMYIDYKRKEVVSMVDMSNVTDKLDAIQTDLDSPDQYKADVSDLEDIKKLVKATVVFSI